MNNPEQFTSPEAEYAGRLETIIRFGQTALSTDIDYQVFTDVAGNFQLDSRDELTEFDASRIETGRQHIEQVYERVLGLTDIKPEDTYYDAAEIVRYHYEGGVPERAYKLQLINMEIAGRHDIEVSHFRFEWNDYYTFTEIGFLQFGRTIMADRIVYPRQDNVTESVENYFADKTGSAAFPLRSLINSALIGSQAAARHLQGVAGESATDARLKEILQRVLRQHQLVRKRPESELVPGQPTESELDEVIRVLFRASNAPD